MLNEMGTAVDPASLARRRPVRLRRSPRVPDARDRARRRDGRRHGPGRRASSRRSKGCAQAIARRRARARVLPLDAARQLRVDLAASTASWACTAWTGRRSRARRSPARASTPGASAAGKPSRVSAGRSRWVCVPAASGVSPAWVRRRASTPCGTVEVTTTSSSSTRHSTPSRPYGVPTCARTSVRPHSKSGSTTADRKPGAVARMPARRRYSQSSTHPDA